MCILVVFEWDERKNKANRTKHGISFESAKLIFDESAFGNVSRTRGGWRRAMAGPWQRGGGVLAVAHTVADQGGEVVRIISARKATPGERKRYVN